MTEAVAIALISNITTIIVVVFCRVLSHREHKGTAATVADTNEKVTTIVYNSQREVLTKSRGFLISPRSQWG